MSTQSVIVAPHKYLMPNKILNEENVKTFRELYRNFAKVERFDGQIDEKLLCDTARQLGLKSDSDVDKQFLRSCVEHEDVEVAYTCLEILSDGLSEPELPIALQLPQLPLSSVSQTVRAKNEDNEPVVLKDVDCVVFVNLQGKDVNDFLQFLTKEANKLETAENGASLTFDQRLILHPQSVLALFIHEKVRSHGSVRQRESAVLHLIEPFTITDEFGTWTFDHLQGLFKIEIRSHTGKPFPSCFTLADDTRIKCKFVMNASQTTNETTSSVQNIRTNSLEQFVHDVCAQENNKQGDNWLKALNGEDIFTFDHLSNLTKNEWDNIRKLTMNAKRILKTAIDREQQSSAETRQNLMQENLPEDISEMAGEQQKVSRSELIANLHLVKLFIYHTLRFHPTFKKYGALPKLEATCIDMSFAEIRQEGYADDGLFANMGEFFLPLTISNRELKMERSNICTQSKLEQLDDLIKEVNVMENASKDAKEKRWELDDAIVDLKQTMNTVYMQYLVDVSKVNKTTGDDKQAKDLQKLDQQWQDDHNQFKEQLKKRKVKSEQWINFITESDRKIDELNTRISNLRTELSQPQRPVDMGLVKPARGFIMYGPPGTGKSEIMSKLSTKLGIVMVGPPLAAGEINRPLVGESERVIIALASRCHRVPYAMCCLSIDEIDSLAPKRDEDSSEGKVDKISVLLSLIDGIKDVPNLMIFCATNRLHMMDEAFLRRMSGKFFVGRPSSQARTKILTQIPEWALEPNCIDRLTVALTNFSGAACKAFTRAITVRCISVQRMQQNYHVKYKEALEIADRTAQQYQILIGSETLPRLLLRNVMSGSTIRNRLLRYKYAGRIIVDLNGGSARIEIIQDRVIAVIEHKLNPNETNVQSLLERLTVYGKDRNVQLIQLVDLNLLASQGAYDDKKVFETLKDRYDECVAYNRSMIIYDLDALVGVNKSESDSSMGRSLSSSIVNQSVYTYVRARFREAVIEQQEESNDAQQQTIEKWAVAVIREPFLLRQFSSDVQFAKTKHEEEELELERRKAEDLLKCVKCKDIYIENENKMGNCIHHDGFIYDNSAPDLKVYSHSDVMFKLAELECDAIVHPERREKLEAQKNKFKWICCDTTVTTTSGAGGCKKGKHGSGELVTDGERPDGPRLNQAMVKLWEAECRKNPEYNEKWLLLLDSRS